MNLQSLLVCSDERILCVLGRVLDELEIEVEHCVSANRVVRGAMFRWLNDLNFPGDLLSTDSIAFRRIDLEQFF